MLRNKTALLKWATLALSLGLFAGCTTMEQYRQMQADIAKTQETADAALASAKRAEAVAAAAERQADAAQTTADKAKHAAMAASKAAARCEEKCNRIMQKAVRK